MASAQDTTRINVADTIVNDSLIFENSESDTLQQDTLRVSSAGSIQSEVRYNAEDSVIITMAEEKVYLYKNAMVIYLDKQLSADYIEFDMGSNIVFAKGMPDSAGNIVGRPVFQDGDQELEAHQLRYNFKTQRGFIEAVRTQQEGGYLHAEKTKKDELGHIHLKNGKYTTCDAEHPHFYVALTKAKSLPNDKIVSGPAYLVLADIPLPIGLPFGFFPNTKTNTSGILLPQYGEETGRGFYLRNGGYYWAVNEYMDLRFSGDIYTNGTWGLRVGSNYRKRYSFNGNLNLRYYENVSGERGLDDYTKSTDYAIQWSHSQDPKASPNQTFRASVNISTRRFDQNHSRILTNALTNTKQSSISYQKRWPNSPFNFTASANHSQNSRTGSVDLNLPKMALNMSRIYPFKGRNNNKDNILDDIQLSYSSYLDNRISTVDTLLFTSTIFENMNNGFRHEIPLVWNLSPEKIRTFTFAPSLRYSGVAYTNHISKRRALIEEPDTSYYRTVTDTIQGLTYGHSFYPSIGMSLAPKIYGMFQFKPDSRIQAIRHVMSPSISFSYIPDVSGFMPDYYRELKDENGDVIERYSIYEGKMFGTPSLGRSSKTMSFSLRNNIEAKIREKSDTTENLKKVKLLDNLNFSTNLNFADSIKFQPVSFNGNTRFLDGKVNLSFRGRLDPYATDSLYRIINRSEFSKSGSLVRLTSAGMSVGMSFRGGEGSGDASERTSPVDRLPAGVTGPQSSEYDLYDEDYYYGEYVDFNVPWSLRIDYSLNYSKPRELASIIQTVRLSGDFSLTPKWKIGFNTGYDFKNLKVTTSNLSIYRDLHCWEMRLTAVPFGRYKSFNFQINVKSAILQDLKYNKRIPWQDNF